MKNCKFLFNEDNNNLVNQYRPNHLGVNIGVVNNYNKGIITIKDGKVLDYEIKEQGDSFFSKVEERDYTKYLVDNQDKLDSIDTVSAATISSTAVLKCLLILSMDIKIRII